MELGPANRHRKAVEKDPVLETYDRIRRRMYKRMARTRDAYSFGAFPLSVAEYSNWLLLANAVRQLYVDGEITAEEAIKKLEPGETKRPTPVEYDIEEFDQPKENPVSGKAAWWEEGTVNLIRAITTKPEHFDDCPLPPLDSTSKDGSKQKNSAVKNVDFSKHTFHGYLISIHCESVTLPVSFFSFTRYIMSPVTSIPTFCNDGSSKF